MCAAPLPQSLSGLFSFSIRKQMKLLTEFRASTAEAKYLLATTAGPVQVRRIHAANTHTAMTFLQLFDADSTASVTLGTTAPRLSIGIPLSSSVTFNLDTMLEELEFKKGLVYAVTAGAANGTAPSVAASVNIFYIKG
jgi:hypothetical protein